MAPDVHFSDPAAAGEFGQVVSLPELEELARRRVPHMIYEFLASGAADEMTVRWNREAFSRIALRPRVLVDTRTVDTTTRLLGRELPHPILLAPTAYHTAFHPGGELATAEGAAAAEAVWVVSTNAGTSIDKIAAAAGAPLWFQLYMQSDREFTRELVQLAERSGYQALCLTVDTPAIGIRDRQQRAGFRLPETVRTPHIHDVNTGRRKISSTARVVTTPSDVEWLLSISRLPVLLKGILTAEDGRRARDLGVAGIIVSNHGGRNLDTLPATAEALPEVVDAVEGEMAVLVDGGIRRGTDVVKAIALGADAVLIGRPYVYGLALAGAEGVRRVVEMLRAELDLALSLCGRASLAEVDRGILWQPPLRR